MRVNVSSPAFLELESASAILLRLKKRPEERPPDFGESGGRPQDGKPVSTQAPGGGIARATGVDAFAAAAVGYATLSARRGDGLWASEPGEIAPERGREPMKNYLLGVWKLRHFWLALVRIDLRNRYRRSMIGMGWSLLQPIAMAAVILTVFKNIFNAEIATFGPYLVAGLTMWNFIAASVNGGCQSFFQNESYIRQQPAPLAIYPLRAALGAAVHLLLGLIVFVALTRVMHGPVNLWMLPALLPAIVLLFIFGWSLAILAGVMNVLFQDTQHLVEVLLQVLFYSTPIIYPAEMLRRAGGRVDRRLQPAGVVSGPDPPADHRRPIPFAGRYAAAAATALAAATLAAATLAGVERRMIFHL